MATTLSEKYFKRLGIVAKYKVNWVDYKLPSGKEFGVAVCGYAGKVCYMTLGNDSFTRSMINEVFTDSEQCGSAEHCLASQCLLNKTEPMHAMHMLEMFQDEQADEETARLWGTESVLKGLLEFAQKMNDIIPEELRKRQEPEAE